MKYPFFIYRHVLKLRICKQKFNLNQRPWAVIWKIFPNSGPWASY